MQGLCEVFLLFFWMDCAKHKWIEKHRDMQEKWRLKDCIRNQEFRCPKKLGLKAWKAWRMLGGVVQELYNQACTSLEELHL